MTRPPPLVSPATQFCNSLRVFEFFNRPSEMTGFFIVIQQEVWTIDGLDPPEENLFGIRYYGSKDMCQTIIHSLKILQPGNDWLYDFVFLLTNDVVYLCTKSNTWNTK
jgi:hypothetical protein